MAARIVSIVVGKMRYSAAYERVDGSLELTTGTAKLSYAVGDDPEEIAAGKALLQLLEENPNMPGVHILDHSTNGSGND